MTNQAISGNGNIQAGGDITIHGIVSGIRAVSDIEQAINDVHAHYNRLQNRKGRTDARFFLALAIGIIVVAGFRVGGLTSILLYGAAGGLLYLGVKLQQMVDRIQTEMAGANLLLTELYRLKIADQINSSK